MSRLNFEDVAVGTELPSLHTGPLTEVHLMRWSSAIENWHRIHYDQRFAVEHDKLPGLLINGSLKQNFIFTMLERWAGTSGRVSKVKFQFRAMNVVGESLTVWGKVTDVKHEPGQNHGLVELELGIRNEQGVESTPGTAVIALPLRGGPELPYPFAPEAA